MHSNHGPTIRKSLIQTEALCIQTEALCIQTEALCIQTEARGVQIEAPVHVCSRRVQMFAKCV